MKKQHKALGFALAVNLLIALCELVIGPLHADGHGQWLFGYVDGAAQLLGMPGFTAADWSGARPDHRWTWAGFFVAQMVNFAFYFVLAAVVMRIRRGPPGPYVPVPRSLFEVRCSISDAGQPGLDVNCLQPDHIAAASPAPAQPTRRQLLFHTLRASAAAGIVSGGYGFFVEARWFEITRHTVPIANLSPGLDGLRIVQLTDIHHGAWMSIGWVRRIIDAANALAPDIVALTGDYVYRGTEYVGPVARELARLRPRIGTLGVLGNHDWWDGGGELTKRIFGLERIPLIDNSRMCITPTRRLVREADHGLCIAGVGDLWVDKCLYDRALGDIPGGMPRILLSHNPDVAEEGDFLKSGHRVDLMLAGHTHGGQIALPGIGPPVTNSAYGQKYANGLVQSPTCPVFISKGLGMTVMPIRLGVRPEIAVITLRAG